jgi:hypothetical protein
MNRKFALVSAVLAVVTAGAALGDPKAYDLVTGPLGVAAYLRRIDNALVITQKDIKFVAQGQGRAADEVAVKDVTVRQGESLYIRNDEDSTVHNIYDEDDMTMVIEKQLPKSVTKITYLSTGTHHIRCAIHPQMKMTIHVTE